MTTAISILAVFILLWLILKPFMLLIIEKQNDEYIKHHDSRKGSSYEISHRKEDK